MQHLIDSHGSRRPGATCPQCTEWRLKFCTIIEDDSEILFQPSPSVTKRRNSFSSSPDRRHQHSKKHTPMVVETQHIFRRSLPPETVLERTSLGSSSSSIFGNRDAPKFSEIVVVTTRRGEEQQATKMSSPTPSSPYLLRRRQETVSAPVRRLLQEDDDQLKSLRERVERYRKEIKLVDDASTINVKKMPSFLSYAGLDKAYLHRSLADVGVSDEDDGDVSSSYYPPSLTRYYSKAPVVYSHHFVAKPPAQRYYYIAASKPISPIGQSRVSTTSYSSYPRTYSTAYSYDDLNYDVPTRSRSLSTSSSRYCHCHPPTAPTPSELTFTASKPREIIFLPRHVEMHARPHVNYSLPLKRTTDYETAGQRSRSEIRNEADSRLESAGLSLERLRAELRDTANKFSKHRQMIDRYLRLDPTQRLENVEPAVIKKYDEVAERIPELLIMNYGLNRRPVDSASLWSTSINAPSKSGDSRPIRGLRNATPFEIRGRIRSVISRTAQSVPRF